MPNEQSLVRAKEVVDKLENQFFGGTPIDRVKVVHDFATALDEVAAKQIPTVWCVRHDGPHDLDITCSFPRATKAKVFEATQADDNARAAATGQGGAVCQARKLEVGQEVWVRGKVLRIVPNTGWHNDRTSCEISLGENAQWACTYVEDMLPAVDRLARARIRPFGRPN